MKIGQHCRRSNRTTVEYAYKLIKQSGGLSPKHSREYWRFSTKAELRGWVEAGERFVQGIKDAFTHGETIYFLPGQRKWNEELAAKLITDAKQGDVDADQVLREVAAEYLERHILPPNELADYVAAYLQQANSSKKQSHKTDYRDWILALTVADVARRFKLNPTRNRAIETEKHCACSIVARATKLSEKTIQNAWHDYEGIADQRTPTNYVGQAIASVTSAGAQRHYLVRFPRVGLTEAMPRPSNRKAQRAKRAKAQRAKR